MKRCSMCGENLPESEFPKRNGTPDGLGYWCKRCKWIRNKELRIENPDKNRIACRRYYRRHREHFRVKNANRKAQLKDVEGQISLEEWNELKLKYNGICPACGEPFDLQIDHVNPFYRGGPNVIANIQALCQSCNNRKHVKKVRYAIPEVTP